MDWGRLRPGFWFQNNPTDLEWDWLLNDALDAFGVTKIESHYAEIGPLKVWTANYPYAYGHQVRPRDDNALPKVATRLKLRRMIADQSTAYVAAVILERMRNDEQTPSIA